MLKFIILFLVTTVCFAQVDFCKRDFSESAVLAGGRVKPLYVHANEIIPWLLGKKHQIDRSNTEIYCYLSLQSYGHKLPFEPSTVIKNHELRKMFKLAEHDRLGYPVLQSNFALLRELLMKPGTRGALKRELNDLAARLKIYQEIASGVNWKIPISKDKWTPLLDLEIDGELDVERVVRALESYENTKVRVELLYAKMHLPHVSLLILLMALVLLGVQWNKGHWIVCAALVVQLADMFLRGYIAGRAPVTNMYETVMFSGMVALVLGLVLFYKNKERTLLIVGTIYNIATLFMMIFADRMLDSSIRPLMPVLRSNFWLSIHVTSVTVSYGAFALSWILANYLLVVMALGKEMDLKKSGKLIHECMKYGVVFLAAGILTGAVWADYSWGRFWGWDPKETWSLIVMLIYMVLLHGRKTNWIDERRYIALSALAFLSVLMAWFGVNYILASGLHSYGFSQGGSLFLILTLFLQLSIFSFYFIKRKF